MASDFHLRFPRLSTYSSTRTGELHLNLVRLIPLLSRACLVATVIVCGILYIGILWQCMDFSRCLMCVFKGFEISFELCDSSLFASLPCGTKYKVHTRSVLVQSCCAMLGVCSGVTVKVEALAWAHAIGTSSECSRLAGSGSVQYGPLKVVEDLPAQDFMIVFASEC